MAGDSFEVGQYEFQCLHGMGEPLYDEVVGHNKLNRPCRIYAPVGTHETLLAYLVRRLLENGANSSFVNRIQDPTVPVADLVADPVAQAGRCLPHERISLPRDLFAPVRANSAGLDLSNELKLAELANFLADQREWRAIPSGTEAENPTTIRNPADRRDSVGEVVEASPGQVDEALALATAAAPAWRMWPAADRAACLLRAADLMEARMSMLLGLIVREAGKSLSNAVGEVREAVDFLRYYGTEAIRTLDGAGDSPLGVVTCISPWNFPLAIFTGQVAAALAAGNAVLAKPAEETPLIAALAVAILHEAGIPRDVLLFLPGAGEVGARLVVDPRTHGVVFTGSTDVARLIQRQLAERLNRDGRPVPLIAETGGQNALVVDSSALAEQVVTDALTSAFDSAGQRCSALRLLCLQDDVADRIMTMLRGGLAELTIGNPDRLSTDIGPVISAEARDGIVAYIDAMRSSGCIVHQAPLPPSCCHGTFVAPAIIELHDLSALKQELFGPVLHVLRYSRDKLDGLLAAINETGYGLTFGVHTRIDETVAQVTAQARAGNIYVNRNLIGAVVGVQPFGGHGLSGTGPKAGGPLYLRRLLATRPAATELPQGRVAPAATAWADWLDCHGQPEIAAHVRTDIARASFGVEYELPGPVGERNIYGTEARGAVQCIAATLPVLLRQIGSALATGNRAIVADESLAAIPALPALLAGWVYTASGELSDEVAAILFDGSPSELTTLARTTAARMGALIAIHTAQPDGSYPLEWLLQERSISTNTTAAGGNANLMMIG